MKEKPILFNTHMVRAILAGRKTVTRRVVKCTHKNAAGFNIVRNHVGEIVGALDYDEEERSFDNYTVPPYKPGDILYVRETWGYDKNVWLYKADFSDEDLKKIACITKWLPSIHMPREAARIFLRVTDVRVERLQEMRAEDSLREGVKLHLEGCLNGEAPLKPFADLWDSTIKSADRGRYGWEANPWVWVIAFERTERPVSGE